MIRIRELLGSNLGRATCYTDRVLAGFFGSSTRIMGEYFDPSTSASFQILSNSLFIYPTVSRYKLQTLRFIIHQSVVLQPFVGPRPLLQFHNLFYTDGRNPWTGISPSQGRYLDTGQHKHRINAHNTDIHALCGIRTHDPSAEVSEDNSCLRLRDHCERHRR
jgi:hypothetical protein